METSTKIAVVGAVLFLIGAVGFAGFFMNALPSLVINKDASTFTNAANYCTGFAIVAILGFMIWMVSVALAREKSK